MAQCQVASGATVQLLLRGGGRRGANPGAGAVQGLRAGLRSRKQVEAFPSNGDGWGAPAPDDSRLSAPLACPYVAKVNLWHQQSRLRGGTGQPAVCGCRGLVVVSGVVPAGASQELDKGAKTMVRIAIAAVLSVAGCAAASAVPVIVPTEPGITGQLEQVAYRPCWWQYGARRCRWVRDDYRVYRYGTGSPDDYRVGTAEWYRAMERDGRLNRPGHGRR